jgi:hypothetical protein
MGEEVHSLAHIIELLQIGKNDMDNLSELDLRILKYYKAGYEFNSYPALKEFMITLLSKIS